ncbi:MAG: glycosyltransferase family 2 protein [Burkholderiaceae bacterium]|nr:glycosyltransferase family 2 protein [Burkholderiaceae bacterium]
MAARLSVIVITKNEAGRLPTCLASVAFADEIIVVDSGSSDGTQEIARGLGARVIETADWPGFGPQKQRALDAATGDWVLSIDADEWLDAQLATAIRQLLADDAGQPAALQVDRLSAFCGQWMRAGSWYPDRLVRLFRRGQARFSDDQVHERLIVAGAAAQWPTLPGLLLHNSITSLHDGIEKMNRYTTGRALDLRGKGRSGGLGAALAHGLSAFLRSYLLRRGFLDGRRGFVLAALDAQSSYARYLKLWLDAAPVPHELPPPGSGRR